MTDESNWPREIWMAEREPHDQGVVTAVLSEFGAQVRSVPRYEGDTEVWREHHRYVDGDIYDGAERYWRERVDALTADLFLTQADAEALVRAALEDASETCRLYPQPHGNRIAESIMEWIEDDISSVVRAFMEKKT